MKKFLPFLLLAFATSAYAQNVGIGTSNPQTKLQVEGAISSTPASAPAQAAYVIPDNTSVFRLTAVGATQANALSMAIPHEGQYLIIYNEDNDACTFAGFTLTGGATMTLNFINGAWRLTGKSDVMGPQGPQGPLPDHKVQREQMVQQVRKVPLVRKARKALQEQPVLKGHRVRPVQTVTMVQQVHRVPLVQQVQRVQMVKIRTPLLQPVTHNLLLETM